MGKNLRQREIPWEIAQTRKDLDRRFQVRVALILEILST